MLDVVRHMRCRHDSERTIAWRDKTLWICRECGQTRVHDKMERGVIEWIGWGVLGVAIGLVLMTLITTIMDGL